MRYYKNGEPYHAGVVQQGEDIYYISSKGYAVKGEHVVHGSMCNGILKRGTYAFGEDYKLIPGSYRAPREKKKRLSRHRRRRSSRSNKTMWQTVGGAAFAAIFLVLGILLVVLDDASPAVMKGDDTDSTASLIELPTFEEDVLLCSETAKQVFDGTLDLASAVKQGDPYRAMAFEYQLEAESAVLHVSENSDMSEYREYILKKKESSIGIDNLKTDTTYYYQVVVEDETYNGQFHTASSNRFLSIPGLVNVRDIGGYRTEDGKTVKQGLLVRGREIDGLVNPSSFIPTDKVEQVQDVFGFAYDMDLRSPDIFSGKTYQSRLGENVGHKFYDACSYGAIFAPEHLESVREIFADLAKPENYPMYVHCTWGADRTGTVVLLLQGLLGVSEEDALTEYHLTGYVDSAFVNTTSMDVVQWGLNNYEGNSFQEKVIRYLTETVGVSEQEIASIQSIFLE